MLLSLMYYTGEYIADRQLLRLVQFSYCVEYSSVGLLGGTHCGYDVILLQNYTCVSVSLCMIIQACM